MFDIRTSCTSEYSGPRPTANVMTKVVAPWRRYLSHPCCTPALVLIGLLLNAPTLWQGLVADDYIHRHLLIGRAQAPKPGSFFGLFNFIDGQPASVQALKESGRLVWWAADALRLSFWRPLSELTHWLDYQLWPSSTLMMHAQNMLWLGLLIVLLTKLYQAIDPHHRIQTALATMLFAFSHMHLAVVSWLAARNQLIAACFIVLTIHAYHLWRSRPSALHGWLAALTFALGLMSAEAGIAALGYLVAYSLTMESKTPWRQRLLALLPFFIMVGVWRWAYNHLHYGSTDSGSYIDPGTHLARFSLAMLERLPTMVMTLLFGVPAGLHNSEPTASQLNYAAMATGLVIFFGVLGHFFKLWSSPQARFYALGVLFAMVPVCATQASDRVLLNGEIGSSAVLAMLFGLMLEHHRRHRGWVAKCARGVISLLMVEHLIIFPLATLSASLVLTLAAAPALVAEPMSLPDVHGQDLSQHVVLVNPPNAASVFYFPEIRNYYGFGNPASTQALANGIHEIKLKVLDESTIKLSCQYGFLDTLTRDVVSKPFKTGDRVDIGQVVVTVDQVNATGTPVEATFHFKVPLHDPQWRFYVWANDAYTAFKLPAPGQQVVLPAIDVGQLIIKRLKAALR
jgi:hypothetical protein